MAKLSHEFLGQMEDARENYALAIRSSKEADKAGLVSDWHIGESLHDYYELLQQL